MAPEEVIAVPGSSGEKSGLAQVWQRLSQMETKWPHPLHSTIVKNVDNIWFVWPVMIMVCA